MFVLIGAGVNVGGVGELFAICLGCTKSPEPDLEPDAEEVEAARSSSDILTGVSGNPCGEGEKPVTFFREGGTPRLVGLE